MSISIGDALLKVGVDKKDFDRDMKGIGASLKKHQKAIGIGMMAMGAAIVGVATKSVLDFAKMGDEIAKMAKRTGFSTIALSELRHAAELSGASLQSLEKASRTLSGTILDANYGLESYVRAFDKLGLSYEDLAKMKPEQQMMIVLEALAGLTSESERAALAADLFGRAGTQLLPMLSDGAEGLAEMRQEAHELGIVFDAEAAVAAEEMTDAMTRLKSGIKGAEIALAEALIPILTPLIDKVTEITKEIGGWVGENKALAQVVTAGGALMIGLGGLLLILPKLKLAVMALSTSLKTLMLNPIVGLIAGLSMLGFGIYSLVKHHTDWNKVVEAATEVNEELEKSQGKLTEGVLKAQKAYNELRIGYGQLEGEELKQIERSQEIIALWEDGTYVLNKATGVLELYGEAVDKLRKKEEALTRAKRKQLKAYKETLSIIGKKFPTGFTEEQWARWRQAGLLTPQALESFQGGGVVPGPIGQPRLAVVHGGEEYLSPGGRAGAYRTANIYILLDGRTIGRVVGQPLIDEIRAKTGVLI